MAHSIYIVEDHPIMRQMIRDLVLSEPDFKVCGLAASGEEALHDLASGEAELVLIDMSLPEMSGIDLVKALRKQRPDLRCMLYSGHGEAIYVERALAAGAHGYVLKGTADELPKAIRHVLSDQVYISEVLRDRG